MASLKEIWQMDLEEAKSFLETSENGLSFAEAKKRLVQNGLNELKTYQPKSWLRIFFNQFKSPLLLILIFSSLIAGFLGEWKETSIILIMIFLSALVGFSQEYKSEKIFNYLRQELAHRALVLREGKEEEIDSRFLVPGDIVLLRIGDIVPADGIILEAKDLLVNEAILTGESFPVEKKSGPIQTSSSLPQDLTNVLFAGTYLVNGFAKILIFRTGRETEIGKVAKLFEGEEITEFEKEVKKFGFFLVRVILYFVVFIFLINAWHKKSAFDSLLFALALAVGITPELLPTVITASLARGAWRLSKKKVLVRKMIALEDLGNADILCSDKTGTLTEGKVILKDYFNVLDKKEEEIFIFSLLCNSAVISGHKASGSPLDVASWQYFFEKKSFVSPLERFRKIDELNFDFQRRRASVLVQEKQSQKFLFISKGAVESILEICQKVKVNGQVEDLTWWKNKIEEKFVSLSKQGLRVLALAYKEIEPKEKCLLADEKDLIFLGFLVFFDPPKKTAKEAIKAFHNLGLEIKILTGDNLYTASYVCQELNFPISQVISGEELRKMSDEEMKKKILSANLFVKVTPEDKLRIICCLKNQGKAVAFLGDGVNDAPALKAADIGISVKEGTEIAQNSSDIILLQKSLTVLLEGVYEGRRTFINTLKYIFNTMSANYGNMISVALATLFLPFLPLLPRQILLNNLVSDIPNLFIATDTVEAEQLRKPKHWDIKVIGRFMVVFGLISSIFDFLTFFLLLSLAKSNVSLFRTGWFVESALSEILIMFAVRTKKMFFQSRPSKILVCVALLTSLVTIVLIYLPWSQDLFEFVTLPLSLLALIFLILLGYLLTVELTKKIYFRKYKAFL